MGGNDEVGSDEADIDIDVEAIGNDDKFGRDDSWDAV